MNVATIGIDLAKNVFQIHGVDPHGHPVLRKQLKRAQLFTFFANLPPCLIGMESCCGSHFFARRLEGFGHTVKLIAPQFVKPYVKSNKNDAADAEAICEAVGRPNMRFVPAKNMEQQAILMLHRAREGFVSQRTALVNQMRGLLMEFGIVFPKGICVARAMIPRVVADESNELPARARQLFQRLFEHLCELDRQVEAIEEQLQAWHRADPASQRLLEVPGIGPRASRTQKRSRTAGRWQRGLVSYPDNIPPAASRCCAASANAATGICENYWSWAPELCFDTSRPSPGKNQAGPIAWSAADTRISQPWRSPTRTRGSHGRFWPTIASTARTTAAARRKPPD
jgi:transposase